MSGKHPSLARPGFTLVEVLVATSLGAALMVGLWTVFDVFSAFQERAATQSARGQLTRGLMHQLQDDLNRVQSRPTEAARRSGDRAWRMAETSDRAAESSEIAEHPAAERIAFLGTQAWLIMELSDLEADPRPLEAAPQTLPRSETGLPARHIVYHFLPPELAELHGDGTGGLTRWELSNIEPQLSSLVAELDRGEWGSAGSILWEADAAIAEFETAALTQVPSTEHVAREAIPEIERFRFRYHDGQRWRETWDSRHDGSLPRAVDILLVWNDGDDRDSEFNDERPADVNEARAEIDLLRTWNELGGQDTPGSVRLPIGFGRHVFCVPASLPPPRYFADTSRVGFGQGEP